MKTKKSKNVSGPSSAVGIMKFKDELSGPQIDPKALIIFIVVVLILVLIIKSAFSL
jgi:preprotein translocase subunit Sec61beta